ncbi:hypothetical protein GmHk_09G025818 [Glycine max]|nr:hypothetical protein GmHk_09G025818 [Glycine max]
MVFTILLLDKLLSKPGRINVTHTNFDAITTSITRPIRPSLKPPHLSFHGGSLADSDTTTMSLNTPMLNSDSVLPLVLGKPMDGGTVRCLTLSQVFAWASCDTIFYGVCLIFEFMQFINTTFCFFSGPLQVPHRLSFVSGGIVLSLIILVRALEEKKLAREKARNAKRLAM